MAHRPEDLQATFCATLVDEWARAGVEHAVVCPGSRSTPLALALATEDRMSVHVHHDERSGGFLALGLALQRDKPVVVLTTSGTAAAELHPAVVEADLACVPLLVCTADRPPELIDVGAPQAIDQTHLFGRSVRWLHDPGVADAAAQPQWRAMAARAVAEAMGPSRGPVHLNLPFREPLLGTPGPAPPGRSEGQPWSRRVPSRSTTSPILTPPVSDLRDQRGVIVAGAGSGSGADVATLAATLGWPILAAPQAKVWSLPSDHVVRAPDAVLRVPAIVDNLRPDIVLRLGGLLASRVVNDVLARWCTEAPVGPAARDLVVQADRRWVDPNGTAQEVVSGGADRVVAAWIQELAGIDPAPLEDWAECWKAVSSAGADAVGAALAAEGTLTEPWIARSLVEALPAGTRLVASSSMPIRDLEWYARPKVELEVHANRGANGIDGVVSTAVGLAVGDHSRATALLIGDVAFLHDSNGLLGAGTRAIDLTIVVVNNDGGGIFSFLPQAGAVEPDRFEQLYGTPHGLDLVALAAAYGVAARSITDVSEAVSEALDAGGVHVLVVRSDRARNVDVHRRLHAAVADAMTEIGPPIAEPPLATT